MWYKSMEAGNCRVKIFNRGYYFIKGKLRTKKLNKIGQDYYFNRLLEYSGKPVRGKEEVSVMIKEKLVSGAPFLAARYGYTEMFVMRTFDFKMKQNYQKAMS